jgi:carboxypeptidase C (cathepsin A)
MMYSQFRRFGAALGLLALCAGLAAWTQPVALRAAEPISVEQPSSEVTGSVTIGRQKIDYKVTTGRLTVPDKTGKAKSNIFFIAYTRKTDAKPENRPLTFCFNGGPGSSSSYVHLAAFGPRCVSIDDDGKSIPKPYTLVDNYNSLLDVTDLVFIDPTSTGYSRAEKDDEAKLFHGLEEDTQSVGEFIRNYVEKYDRSKSPTFIAGESYGTTRAAALTKYLQEHEGVKLVGIMLISTVLDFSTITFGPGNDLANILYLPAYTASALHHKKIEGDQTKLLEESEKFAHGEYAEALKKGKDLTEAERTAIAKSLVKYTGLSEEYVLKVNLKINATAFRAELLRESKEVIGRYDSRVKAKTSGMGKGGLGDPSNALTSAPLAECMKSYLTDDLKVQTDLKYNMMGKVNPWNFGTSRGKATVVPRLREAMEKDSSLRVFVACGYCDLATPYFAAKYTMANLGGPKRLQERITLAYYEGGHMMYTVKQSHERLKEDMARFIAGRER